MKESTFSFWEDAEFGALVDQPFCYAETDWNLTQGENQAQQWFFEARGNNGYLVTLKLSTKNWSKLPCQVEPDIHLVVAAPGGEQFQEYQSFKGNDFAKEGDQLNFKLGENSFTQSGNVVNLTVAGQVISANIRFTGVIDPWKPGDGKIAYADKGKKYCHWLVPMPKASVNGQLTINGEQVELEGAGYYDYWDTNFPAGEIMREARKGRFFGEKGTFIFSKFKGRSLYSFKPVYAYLFAWEDKVVAKGPHFDGKFTGKELVFFTRDKDQAELKLAVEHQLLNAPWWPEAAAYYTKIQGKGRLTWRKTLPEFDQGVGVCERIEF